jgi:hypothetical protein
MLIAMAHPSGGSGAHFNSKHTFAEAYAFVGTGTTIQSMSGEQITVLPGTAGDGVTPTLRFVAERNVHGRAPRVRFMASKSRKQPWTNSWPTFFWITEPMERRCASRGLRSSITFGHTFVGAVKPPFQRKLLRNTSSFGGATTRAPGPIAGGSMR